MKGIRIYALVCLFSIGLISGCSDDNSTRINETLHVRHRGADMPAYVHGNAADKVFVIVLHGAGSYGLAFRDGIFTESLEENYVMVYWDQRGQAMSEGHYSTPDDLIGLMIEDVLALTKVLKARYGDDIQLFLMGHSWGGMLGTSVLLTENYQSIFKGFISVDGAHDFPLAARSRAGLIIETADEQIAKGMHSEEWQLLENEATQLDTLQEDYYEQTLLLSIKTMKLLAETGIVSSSVSLEKIFRASIANNPISWQVSNFFNQPVQVALNQDYSLTDSLDRITIPILLIYGKYDVSVPPALGRDALERVASPDKTLVIFDKSIHHPHDTEAVKFGMEVIQFISRNK